MPSFCILPGFAMQVGGQSSIAQAGHYTPMMDPSSRRVDYLDLATPQSARSFHAMHHSPGRAHSPALDHRPHPPPFLDDMASMPPAPPPMLPDLHPPGQYTRPFRASQTGRQTGIPHRKARQRAGLREHALEVYQDLAQAGIPPEQMVSSMQDLFDANYPYKATPWVLQDIGHKAPAIWRAIAALAVRAPQHLPAAIRDRVRPHSHCRSSCLCVCLCLVSCACVWGGQGARGGGGHIHSCFVSQPHVVQYSTTMHHIIKTTVHQPNATKPTEWSLRSSLLCKVPCCCYDRPDLPSAPELLFTCVLGRHADKTK